MKNEKEKKFFDEEGGSSGVCVNTPRFGKEELRTWKKRKRKEFFDEIEEKTRKTMDVFLNEIDHF